MAPIELKTERFRLRLLIASDLEKVHKLHLLSDVNQYNTLGIPMNINETKTVLKSMIRDEKKNSSMYSFIIEAKITGQFAGIIALELGKPKFKLGEVWCKLLPNYWNNGVATEVTRKILDFGFTNLNLHRIEAGCAVDNLASAMVLEKVGMTREGRKRKVLPLTSGWSDNYEYAILESDPRLSD